MDEIQMEELRKSAIAYNQFDDGMVLVPQALLAMAYITILSFQAQQKAMHAVASIIDAKR